MSAGERLDVLLVRRGLVQSRERAQAAIAAGLVTVNGVRADKASQRCRSDADLAVSGEVHPYVSRGGLKLEKALQTFGLNPAGAVALDVGASTGGFTDCLLRHGAIKVYAVDVGTDQLAASLRADPRVVSLERTNARYLTRTEIPEPVDFMTIDVAFISLGRLWDALVPLLAPHATVIALVKPQFEAGPERVGSRGVVRSASVHTDVVVAAATEAIAAGLTVRGLTFSPIRGPEGNIEFLLHLGAGGRGLSGEALARLAAQTVRDAHASLRQ
ncbi:MAG: TlyA family RNA methyltransferase [Chloroflexota bacterium]